MSGLTRPIRSLPPVIDERCTKLVLGSMPGEASLQAQRYYAHPRNGFWTIVHAIYGCEPAPAYEDRVAFVLSRGIALWDVLAACERSGSLDAAIRKPVANDLAGLLRQYPRIRSVYLNGGKAHELFMRLAAPALAGRSLSCRRLPSTSPAHAIPLARKVDAWRVLANAPEDAAGEEDGGKEDGGGG